MRIAREFDFWMLRDECWDCDDVLDAVENADMEDALMDFLEDNFCDAVPTITEVNDLLRFDGDYVLESLGIEPEEEEEEEDDDYEEDEEDEELEERLDYIREGWDDDYWDTHPIDEDD